MTAITITNHELLQLKLLLRDIQLIQKMNSPFDNEAIEILSFKIIEHLNASQTLKDYHIVDTNEMVSSQTEISDEEIEKASRQINYGGGSMGWIKDAFIKGAKWYREQLKQRQ
jgi:hypothetical protein